MSGKGNVIQLTVDGLEHEVEKYLRIKMKSWVLLHITQAWWCKQ
jgi:hypothetical protein